MPWVSALAWSALGAAISGLFTALGLWAAKAPLPFIVGTGVAAVGLLAIAAISFAVSHGLQKSATDRVDELRRQMDSIQQENDLEAPL